MARATRTARFPADALKMLFAARPFSYSLWQAATSTAFCVRIGNDPVRNGQQEGLKHLRALLDSAEPFAGGFCEMWALKEAIIIETELAYRAPDGSSQRIPCSVVARTTHGLLHDLRIYLDPSPLRGFRPAPIP